MIVLAVINLKGGTAKTTSAVYAAHVLHERGRRVLLVDADPQSSALLWHELSGFPFPAVGLPSGKLHRELPGIAGDRFDVVVVDTPPTEHGRMIALSAARAATHVLVPIGPTRIEYERLSFVRALLDDADDLLPEDRPAPAVAVLLARTITGAASTAVYREVITADGWRVLRTVVPRREALAQALGEPVTRAGSSAYGDVVDELLVSDRTEVPA